MSTTDEIDLIDLVGTLSLDATIRFRQPSRSEIADWWYQTKGMVSKEMAAFMGWPSTRSNSDYRGPLSVAQQCWIIQELLDL